MSTINELINKQALAVKGASNAIKAAEALEQAAKFLRADAAKPIKMDFAAIVKEKQNRLAKFGQAIKDCRAKEAHQLLTSAGYVRGNHDPKEGTAVYSLPGKQRHYLLKIKGESFTVTHGNDIKQAKTSLRDLQSYLEINQTK